MYLDCCFLSNQVKFKRISLSDTETFLDDQFMRENVSANHTFFLLMETEENRRDRPSTINEYDSDFLTKTSSCRQNGYQIKQQMHIYKLYMLQNLFLLS